MRPLYIEYTQYAQRLFNADISGCIKDVKDIILNKLKEKYPTQDIYSSFIDDFKKSRYIKLFQGDLYKFLRLKLRNRESKNPEDIIPILMYLFPDVNDLIHILTQCQPNIELYSCSNCEKYYCSTAEGYKNGWGCPDCNDDNELNTKLQSIIHNIDSSYNVIDEFDSLEIPLLLHHEKCNCNTKIKPSDFIFDDARCKCNFIITNFDAKKRIEEHSQFIYINYDPVSKKATIQCKDCGEIFEIVLQRFLAYPRCRICGTKRMTPLKFEKLFYRMVGKEYTIIKGFERSTEKVILKHNICGHVATYNHLEFLNGKRCEHCNTKMSPYWLKAYELLCEYKVQYGNTNVAKREKYKGFNLGPWCQMQRKKYNKGILSEHAILMLDELEFRWIPKEDDWNQQYELYMRYIEINGTTKVPSEAQFENVYLGRWVKRQKERYKKGILRTDRYDRLLALGVEFK